MVAPVLAFVAASMDRGYQTDFWHHLARGREIVRQGIVVDADAFTFTAGGHLLRDANWLTQVGYYRLFEWGGLPLTQFVNALILAATMAVLFRLCRRVSGSSAAAMAVGVFVFLGLWQLFLIRPQTLSLLLFVIVLGVLHEAKHRPRLLFVPPIVMTLWANVHGGFPIGLVLIGAFAMAAVIETLVQRWAKNWGTSLSQSRNVTADTSTKFRAIGAGISRTPALIYVLCLAGSIAATLLNPYGWTVYQYVGDIAHTAAARHVEEWLPPTVDLWIGKAFWASIVGVVLLYVTARRWPTVREVCLIVCFLPLAGRSMRMVAWWLLAIAPIIAELLSATVLRNSEAQPARRSLVPAAILALLLGVSVMSLPWLDRYNPLFAGLRSPHRTEADLRAVCEQGLAGPSASRVFARLEWGEYLDWSLGPRRRVFMDGRIEAFSDPQWKEYCTVTSGAAGWERVLDGYGIDCLMLDTTYHSRLLLKVRRSGIWRETCVAGPAVLFVRRNTQSVVLINP
ncbi:MAG: hypothetical protein JWL69_2528 [Phycisphaerales bacterium]|nr:hypothetical protein [Phycisphaerales bacterium]MDB5353992.1 hypothetical protein [Phycisphaerales bacterium]